MASMNLTAKLGLNNSGFQLGIKQAESMASKFAKDFGRTMSSSLVGWFGGGWVANKLLSFFDGIIEKSNTIVKTANTWDVPISKMAMWERVASKLGMELNDITALMSKVGEASDKAFGGDDASKKAFATMGLPDAKRMGMNSSEILQTLFQNAGKMSAGESNAAMRELLGARKWSGVSRAKNFDFEKEQSKTVEEETYIQLEKIRQAKKDAARAVSDAAARALAATINPKGDISALGGGYGFGGQGNASALKDSEEAKRQARDELALAGVLAIQARKEQSKAEAARQQKIKTDAQNEITNTEFDRIDKLFEARDKTRAQVESSIYKESFGKSDLSASEKQGIFLRGVPTESANIPKQQLETSKSIRRTVENIDKKLVVEHFTP